MQKKQEDEKKRADWTEYMRLCRLCPRSCQADRMSGQRGYCKMTSEIMLARAALHMWEEPCISGEHGSGTVFFSGCQVGCVFCQNRKIADGTTGKRVTVERLSEIYLELQAKGAHNINLVTPTQFVPQIRESLIRAKDNGLRLPVVYNTSAYESVETLRLLEGFIDIYLPDFKYMSEAAAKKYSNAPDYPDYAKQAIAEMYRQTGAACFDQDGMMKKGLIVRHLVLPGLSEDSKQICTYLYKTYQHNIFLSIMNQFTPFPFLEEWPELNRTVTEEEYNAVVDHALAIGIENGFIQEGETAMESFIPEFDFEGV